MSISTKDLKLFKIFVSTIDMPCIQISDVLLFTHGCNIYIVDSFLTNIWLSNINKKDHLSKSNLRRQQGFVVKAESTHAGGPGLIPGVVRKKCLLAPATRQDRHLNGSINQGPLYHYTLWASKRSLKASKCVGLLDVLVK